jgi:predicted PurR-regulated permease PerM
MLDGAVVGALVFLALGVTALLATTWTLIPQINKTLGAYEKLADTLEAELGPTLKEVQKVVVSVGELKQIAGQRVQDVSTKVEDVTGNLTKVATSAKKESSVYGAGIWAGLRSYLEGKDHKEYGDKKLPANVEVSRKDVIRAESRQVAMDRGEENVGLKR